MKFKEKDIVVVYENLVPKPTLFPIGLITMFYKREMVADVNWHISGCNRTMINFRKATKREALLFHLYGPNVLVEE